MKYYYCIVLKTDGTKFTAFIKAKNLIYCELKIYDLLPVELIGDIILYPISQYSFERKINPNV